MNLYLFQWRGTRGKDSTTVTVEPRLALTQSKQESVPLYSNIQNFAQSFEWGYSGAGPRQLATALVCSYFEKTFRLQIVQDLQDTNELNKLILKTLESVDKFPRNGWELQEVHLQLMIERGYIFRFHDWGKPIWSPLPY